VSANVLMFPKRRVRTQPQSDAPAYYCMKCSDNCFALYNDGSVRCLNCHVPIRNLTVVEKPL
jgi:hypothetical protein